MLHNKKAIVILSLLFVALVFRMVFFGKTFTNSEIQIQSSIYSELGVTTESFSKSDYLAVTNLVIVNKGISDVGLLSECQNLQYLNLANNQVEDVSPLSNLRELVVLDLQGNPVSKLFKTKKLENLEVFRASNLRGLDGKSLQDLGKLKELWIPGSSLEDDSFLKSLPHLEVLNLSASKINNFDAIYKLKNLKICLLEGNPGFDRQVENRILKNNKDCMFR